MDIPGVSPTPYWTGLYCTVVWGGIRTSRSRLVGTRKLEHPKWNYIFHAQIKEKQMFFIHLMWPTFHKFLPKFILAFVNFLLSSSCLTLSRRTWHHRRERSEWWRSSPWTPGGLRWWEWSWTSRWTEWLSRASFTTRTPPRRLTTSTPHSS